MFGTLGLTTVILPCETGEGFEKCFVLMIYHEILVSKSHIINVLVYNVTDGKFLILYRNYREGSEVHFG